MPSEDRPDFWDLWNPEDIDEITLDRMSLEHDRHQRPMGDMHKMPRGWHFRSAVRAARARREGYPIPRPDLASYDWPAPLRSLPRDREETQEGESPKIGKD